MSCFELFPPFSGLEQNTSKCEIAGIENLHEVKVTLCGMNSTNLTLS